MNKIRIFQNVKYKRIVAGFSIRNLGTILLFLVFLPYIITFLFGNLWNIEVQSTVTDKISVQLEEGSYYIKNKTKLGDEEIPFEVYVADKLFRVMGDNFEEEALKAQAILIRTDLIAKYDDNQFVEDVDYGRKTISEKCRMAAAQTKGMYLVWEGKPVMASYFAISNGATRNAKELFDEDYPYLKSVPCGKDFLAENYSSNITYSLNEFNKTWNKIPESTAAKGVCDIAFQQMQESDKEAKEKVIWEEIEIENKENKKMEIIRESTGYVNAAKYGNKCVTGEQFRYFFNISSSCFYIEIEDGFVVMNIKGAGHGLGMSQFYANEMAKEDSTFDEILAYFFQNATITKFE